jgi:hypothetical protein
VILDATKLETVLSQHRTLDEAVQWGLAHSPPLLVADVVVQDEYTHDVLLPCRDDLWIVYDTT